MRWKKLTESTKSSTRTTAPIVSLTPTDGEDDKKEREEEAHTKADDVLVDDAGDEDHRIGGNLTIGRPPVNREVDVGVQPVLHQQIPFSVVLIQRSTFPPGSVVARAVGETQHLGGDVVPDVKKAVEADQHQDGAQGESLGEAAAEAGQLKGFQAGAAEGVHQEAVDGGQGDEDGEEEVGEVLQHKAPPNAFSSGA